MFLINKPGPMVRFNANVTITLQCSLSTKQDQLSDLLRMSLSHYNIPCQQNWINYQIYRECHHQAPQIYIWGNCNLKQNQNLNHKDWNPSEGGAQNGNCHSYCRSHQLFLTLTDRLQIFISFLLGDEYH